MLSSALPYRSHAGFQVCAGVHDRAHQQNVVRKVHDIVRVHAVAQVVQVSVCIYEAGQQSVCRVVVFLDRRPFRCRDIGGGSYLGYFRPLNQDRAILDWLSASSVYEKPSLDEFEIYWCGCQSNLPLQLLRVTEACLPASFPILARTPSGRCSRSTWRHLALRILVALVPFPGVFDNIWSAFHSGLPLSRERRSHFSVCHFQVETVLVRQSAARSSRSRCSFPVSGASPMLFRHKCLCSGAPCCCPTTRQPPDEHKCRSRSPHGRCLPNRPRSQHIAPTRPRLASGCSWYRPRKRREPGTRCPHL